MENNKFDMNKIGVICSVTQIIISTICLIYGIVTKENFTIWIIMLCSGVFLLSSNIISKKDKE